MLQKRRVHGKTNVVLDFPTKRANHHAIQDDIGKRLHVVHEAIQDAIGEKPHVRDFPRRREQHAPQVLDFPRRREQHVPQVPDFSRREQHDGIQYDMNHRLAKYPPRRILKGVIVKRDFPLQKGIVDDFFEKRPFSPLKENRSTIVDDGCENRPLWPPLAEKNNITNVGKGCEKRPLLPSSLAEKNKITNVGKGCEKRPILPPSLAEKNNITNVGKGCEKRPLLPPLAVENGCGERTPWPPPGKKNKLTIVDNGFEKRPLSLAKEKVESVFKDIHNLGDEFAMDCSNFLLKLRDDGEDEDYLYNKEEEEFEEGEIDDDEDEDDVYNKEEFKERKIIDCQSEVGKILEMYDDDDDDYNKEEEEFKEGKIIDSLSEVPKEEIIFDGRSEVKKILEMLKKRREYLSYEYGRKGIHKKGIHIHIEAAKYLERNFHFINTTKTIGHVPGVEIGDEFQFRAELSIIGLHRKYIRGIDCLKRESDGIILATSIVSTSRAANDMNSCDFLIYVGEGRNPKVNHQFSHKDQVLERGNLALKNSMEEQSPVRVIRKGNLKSHNNYVGEVENKLVYDGLYMVKKCWQERGEFGKLVFKFDLRRIDGQPKVTQEFVCKSNKFRNKSILKGNEMPSSCFISYDESNSSSL